MSKDEEGRNLFDIVILVLLSLLPTFIVYNYIPRCFGLLITLNLETELTVFLINLLIHLLSFPLQIHVIRRNVVHTGCVLNRAIKQLNVCAQCVHRTKCTNPFVLMTGSRTPLNVA